MELLGRIVPAIRETRLPLITGYAWLLAIWLTTTAVTTIETDLSGDLEPETAVWAISKAFGVLSELGLGIAVTVAAYMTGSLAGYLWDLVMRPLDERIMPERSIQLGSEGQLRVQLALPLAIGITALGRYDIRYLGALIIPALLTAHGMRLWGDSRRKPMPTDLSGQELEGVNLSRARLDGANLSESQLIDAHLKSAQLANADLRKANLHRANLQRANLYEAKLWQANLQGANLQRANLQRANLQEADLRHTNLNRANLQRANLQGANLRKANLQGANLEGANLQGVHWDPEHPPTWPDGFSPPENARPQP